MKEHIPRRQGKFGRSARQARRLKLMPNQRLTLQGSHKGFRKSKPSFTFIAPMRGNIEGYISLRGLIGHAEALVKFEEGSNIELDVREGSNPFPKTLMKGSDIMRIYIKPLDEEATLQEVLIGLQFEEAKN